MLYRNSIIAGLALCFAVSLFAAGPAISFDNEEHDWGVIYQGEVASHNYKVQNTGDAALLISQVKTTCGCTVARDWPKRLEPGESGIIGVSFNSGARQGRNEKTIAVHSNDTARPLVQLKIHGDIKKLVEITPSHVVSLGTITLGEVAEGTFEVIPLVDDRMSIKKLGYNDKLLSVSYEEITKETGAAGYLFKVKLKQGLPIGRVYETITLETDLARKKAIEVKVTANVMGKIRSYPPRLTFSGVRPGQAERREFTLKRTDGKLLEVQKILADREEVVAEVVGGPAGSVVLINVSANFVSSDPKLARMMGTIKVYTNDPDQPVVDVLYSVYFARTPAPASR